MSNGSIHSGHSVSSSSKTSSTFRNFSFSICVDAACDWATPLLWFFVFSLISTAVGVFIVKCKTCREENGQLVDKIEGNIRAVWREYGDVRRGQKDREKHESQIMIE